MSRRFNTAGPCDAADHYMVPPEQRLEGLEPLIEEKAYFVVLAGRAPGDVPPDDVRYVGDLGLVRGTLEGGLEVANPIYREVIPTVLAANARAFLPRIAPSWLFADGRLDPAALLAAFLDFWRRHGEPLMRSAPYHEIAPHLVLMAFLHRVANGGGTIEREYAIGSGRMDLCLRYAGVTVGIELKVWRDGDGDPASEGLAQLERDLAGVGGATPPAGWLVIFDRRARAAPIAERTSAAEALTPGGRLVQLVRA